MAIVKSVKSSAPRSCVSAKDLKERFATQVMSRPRIYRPYLRQLVDRKLGFDKDVAGLVTFCKACVSPNPSKNPKALAYHSIDRLLVRNRGRASQTWSCLAV